MMLKNLLRISFLLPVSLMLVLSSCEEESVLNSTDTLEAYVDEVVFRMDESGNFGRFGCYELVFPINIVFPDSTEQSVGDYEELRTVILDWRTANPDAEEKPTLAFPIEVLTEDGELISVEDWQGLKALKRACRRSFFSGGGHGGYGGRCGACFDLIYPLSTAFPDGTTQEVADRSELKDVIRAWKDENPDAEERPSLAFPIEVELEDGTTQTINSAEELEALRESCSGN